ncbi:MAG: DoxX family membrane protein [Patescibacteria group bacterium]|nr:DoxX family membrane protein [Patescibacteria group bacterium]
MLNLFPTMFLSLFAHALLRITLGTVFIYLGYRHLVKDRVPLEAALANHWPSATRFAIRYLGVIQIIIGGMFFVGAYTQVAAIAAIVLSIKMLALRRYLAHPAIPQPLFYVLTLGISGSLFITGAGVLAFDLPL